MRLHERGQPSPRMGNFRHVLRVWFATGTLIALSACGGGGGGGGTPPPSNPGNPPPANRAPTIAAGEDQAIQLPTNSVTVTASANDPDGTTPTVSWASAPADGVTFEAADAASTTVTFADAGTYTLTATASDGSLTASDALVVTVTAASGGEEPGAPEVSAGEDQTIEYPMSATLNGSATDDSSSLTYEWTSDVDGVTFADAAAAATTAKFAAQGTYTLTLTASDGTESGSDSLVVTVGAPLYPAADDDTDPNSGWTVAAAADVGMDDARLEEARAYAETAGGSGVIVRHGRIVKSWGEIDNRLAVGSDIKSATKSIGGIALLLALDDGLVTLDTLATTLPGFGERPPENVATGWLDSITVRQLATHTAGFEKNNAYSALVDEPGTTWRYSDGGLNWLADLLTHVYDKDLEDLMIERVWSVLGVEEGSDVEWRDNALHDPVNANNVPQRELASGMTINTQSMARVGLLFLREGQWAGTPVFTKEREDLVSTPDDAVAQLPIAVAPDNNHPRANANYGLLWWTNAAGELPDVPRDAYWAWGLGDSLIVVIPSLDIVVARAGATVFGAPSRALGTAPWTADYTVLAPLLNPIVESVQQ